jgi:RsiW-degrading membrane proteinase PrsW (M82 family)
MNYSSLSLHCHYFLSCLSKIAGTSMGIAFALTFVFKEPVNRITGIFIVVAGISFTIWTMIVLARYLKEHRHNKLRDLYHDASAVSYLIIVGCFFTIAALGIGYSFISDATDFVTPIYSGTPLSAYNDANSDWGLDFLLFLVKFFLIPALLVVAYFMFTMAQKPERSWP